MVQEVAAGIYRIEVPLPGNPLKYLNSYLIRGRGKNLLVDSGFNRPECREYLLEGLRELQVDLSETEFFITHCHADHYGLLASLAGGGSRVYCSRADAELIDKMRQRAYWQNIGSLFRLHGFSAAHLEEALKDHPGNRYGAEKKVNFAHVADGDEIAVGDYVFTCVQTPGHTPQHMCLYEAGQKILFSGDHILDDITPNISLWEENLDSLGDYLKSLDKVSGMEIDLVLPGHRRLLAGCRKRIAELKAHHQTRLDEILAILRDGEMSAYEVASCMSWDLTFRSWEQFPLAQKWFAAGEAMAHLKYLLDRGKVKKTAKDGTAVFSLKR
ncbi:MAG: MBL fold metallo-hydrolase [Peptococcaceae bacterium]|nr:MBL fold metallo-hydrolase [Peptococcaceae bacterium]MDH7525589.1 MBL fold metallo-hydrolase [Peptococcaceae bacterium]